jgi:hypothetical protein
VSISVVVHWVLHGSAWTQIPLPSEEEGWIYPSHLTLTAVALEKLFRLGRQIPLTLFFFKITLATLLPFLYLEKSCWDLNYKTTVYQFEKSWYLWYTVSSYCEHSISVHLLYSLSFISAALCSFQHINPLHVFLDLAFLFLKYCRGHCIFNVHVFIICIQKYNCFPFSLCWDWP